MFKLKINCTICNGTGLFRGACERDKSAVLCKHCYGRGYVLIPFYKFNIKKYSLFKGIKHMKDVNRVFLSSFVFHHSDVNRKGIRFEEGGCTYEDWLNGINPKPVKDLYCPRFWLREIKSLKVIDAEISSFLCERFLNVSDNICNCNMFSTKELCWEYYENLINILEIKNKE